MKHTARQSIAVAIAFMAAGAAYAQSNLEVNSGPQFNFASPGARSLGIGGAFIGLGDDATTAYTNPAGLVNVASPEISAEIRAFRYDNSYPTRGHAFGPPTGKGVDQTAGVENGESHDAVLGLSFASFVYPGKRWSLALYRHKLADVSVSAETEGIFYTVRNPEGNDDDLIRAAPSRSELRVQIVGYGLAAAYRLHDRLSLGFSTARYSMDMEAQTLRYAFTPTGPPTYTDVINEQSQSGRDSRITSAAGLMWQATDVLTVGATYRQAAAFSADVTTNRSADSCSGDFNVPDVAGVGASLRLRNDITMTADYKRIGYSRLSRNFVTFDKKNRCQTESRAVDYAVDDAGEVHFGIAKLVYAGERSFIVSVGWWNDPDHSLRYIGDDPHSQVLFKGGRSDNHFSAGVGINIDQFQQIYVAYDVSRRQQALSISTILRF